MTKKLSKSSLLLTQEELQKQALVQILGLGCYMSVGRPSP